MSKSKKSDVGKGIRALLANIDKAEKTKSKVPRASKKIIEIAENELLTSYLEPNPFQPRKDFKSEDLDELISSIEVHGIIQPIAVRKLNNKSYQIISGERRWRAAKKLKLKNVPVHILEADDQAMLEIALLENVQRADLNPLEIAIGYERLINECKLTHEELSKRIGKKRSSISNYLRLLKLSPSVQNALQQDKISMGHAKVLAGIERIEMQTFLLGKIIQNDLSVRATENLIKAAESTPSKGTITKKVTKADAEVAKIKKQISEKIGTKVTIQRSNNGKGFIKIPFVSDTEFNDIIDSLLDN